MLWVVNLDPRASCLERPWDMRERQEVLGSTSSLLHRSRRDIFRGTCDVANDEKSGFGAFTINSRKWDVSAYLMIVR